MLNWKQQVRKLKKETYTIYLACKDSRVPWYARVLAQRSLLLMPLVLLNCLLVSNFSELS